MWQALASAARTGAVGELNALTTTAGMQAAWALNAFVGAAAPALPPPLPPGGFQADRPLAGVPFAIKANLCAAGMPATAGSAALAGYTAPYTATAVARLQAAGGHVVGVTNMDEFGMGSATAFSAHGACRNPWGGGDLTPGGSSGGSAVAVATGGVAVALGSDTGGSVRQPAAFCGVVGFKPSYGAIPRWGLIAYASSLDTVGILARRVEDAAFVFDVVRGADGCDDTALRTPPAAPAAVLRAHLARRPGPPSLAGLRIGIPVQYSLRELPPAVGDVWDAGAAVLAAAGATVVPVSLPHTASAMAAYYVLATAEAASNLARYDGVRYGSRVPASPRGAGSTPAGGEPGGAAADLFAEYCATRSRHLGLEVKRRIMVGNHVLSLGSRARYYDAAVAMRRAIARDFNAALRPPPPDSAAAATLAASPINALLAASSAPGAAPIDTGVDVLLTPTSPTLPWRSSDTAAQHPVQMYMNDVMTLPASLARLPAISVPVATVPGGPSGAALPVGLQLIGRFADEATLLTVAAALQHGARFNATPPPPLPPLPPPPPHAATAAR